MVDLVERRALAQYVAMVTARSMGAEVEIPDPAEARRDLDRWLESEPPKQDDEQETLKAALFPRDRGI